MNRNTPHLIIFQNFNQRTLTVMNFNNENNNEWDFWKLIPSDTKTDKITDK